MKYILLNSLLFLVTFMGYSGTTERVEAETFDLASGVRTELNSSLSGGGNVGYIKNGTWIMFSNHSFNKYNLQFDFACSGTVGGYVEIRLDSSEGVMIGKAEVAGSSGWSDYKISSALISETSGVHDLYFVFTGGSGYLFNIDYFEIFTSNPDAVNFSLSVTSSNSLKGSARSNILENLVAEGTEIILSAKANHGYDFVKWTDANGNFISSLNPFAFPLTADTSIIAQFSDGILYNQPAPATGGFANMAGKGLPTTSGGNGGYMVVVKNLDDLLYYAASPHPYTILVNGYIEAKPWAEINVTSNKTIVGYGDEATLKNIELHMVEKHNIIIRNLIIRDSKVPEDLTKEFDYDAIQSDSCHHLWIDHCFLANCNDGLIDLRYSSDYVTVSWNRLTHNNKAFGIGWTPATDYRITIHHNRIDSTTQRNPSFGNGIGHLYNNYLSNISSYGNYARGIAVNVIQNSCFYKVKDPVCYDTDALLYSSGNQFVYCSGSIKGNVSSMPFYPSEFYDFTLDPTSEVIEKVEGGAGPQWFVSDEYSSSLPNKRLTTSVVGGGTLSPESGSYIAGGKLHLKATPMSGWKFDHWSGDLDGNCADTTIVLDFDLNVNAHFTPTFPDILHSVRGDAGIKCYYDSFMKTIHIETDTDSNLSIYSLEGRNVISNIHVNTGKQAIPVNNLGKGVFLVRFQSDSRVITKYIAVD